MASMVYESMKDKVLLESAFKIICREDSSVKFEENAETN